MHSYYDDEAIELHVTTATSSRAIIQQNTKGKCRKRIFRSSPAASDDPHPLAYISFCVGTISVVRWLCRSIFFFLLHQMAEVISHRKAFIFYAIQLNLISVTDYYE